MAFARLLLYFLALAGCLGIASFVMTLVWGPANQTGVSQLQRALRVVQSQATVTTQSSLSSAIAELEQITANECVILITGNVVDLGTDPTLCFFPVTKNCKHIIVRGVRTNVTTTTVEDNSTTVSPQGRNYHRLTLADPISQGQQFVENTRLDRVFATEDGASEGGVDVTVISSPRADNVEGAQGPYIAPIWRLNDTVTFFNVQTVISWSGALTFDIPFNEVVFENVIMRPTTEGSAMNTPDGATHHVRFHGCQLEAQSTSRFKPSYQGSYMMQGIKAIGMVPGAVFTGEERGRCLHMQSAWVTNATTYFSGDCSAFWLRSTYSPGDAIQVTYAASFTGSGIYIQNSTSSGFAVTKASNTYVDSIDVDIYSGFAGVLMGTNTQSAFYKVNVQCKGTCSSGISVFRGSKAELGSIVVDANLCLNLRPGSFVDLYLDAQFSGFNQPAMFAGIGTVLGLHFMTNFTVNMGSVASPVVACAGCQFFLYDASTSFHFSTMAGVPLFQCSQGGHLYGAFGGNIVNEGANPGDVLKCGANAISDWTAPEDDYTTGSSVKCTCSR